MRKHSSAAQLNASGTPTIRGSSHGGVSSSTPKADEAVFFGNKNVDVSAIGDLHVSRGGQPVTGQLAQYPITTATKELPTLIKTMVLTLSAFVDILVKYNVYCVHPM